MYKSTVTRLFVGGMIAIIAGVLLAFGAVWAAYANDVFQMSRPVEDEHPLPGNGPWTIGGVIIVAVLAMMSRGIAGLTAWIGALLNTAQLDDKTWFVLLLVLGLFSFGLLAMIAYVIAGPDGAHPRIETGVHAPA